MDLLEQRVREGASTFEFNALLAVSGEPDSPAAPNPSDDRFEFYLSTATAVARAAAPQPELLARGSNGRVAKRRYPTVSALVMVLLAILAVGGWGLYLRQSTPMLVARKPAVVIVSPQAPPLDAGESGNRIGLPRPGITPGERSESPVLPTPISEEVRRGVFAAYGLDPEDKRNVPVRLIPAELGGSNHFRNVFPVTPWFAGLKVRLDAFLTEEVRAGRMTLNQAETELTTNWVRACHIHYIRNYGSSSTDKARRMEDRLRWRR